MDDIAGIVDLVGLVGIDLVALEVDLDERGRRHLLVHQPERVDQEVVLRPRHPGRDMGVNQVVVTHAGEGAIDRRQPDPLFPFFRRHRIRPVATHRLHVHGSTSLATLGAAAPMLAA
jgi:hypothetical protein